MTIIHSHLTFKKALSNFVIAFLVLGPFCALALIASFALMFGIGLHAYKFFAAMCAAPFATFIALCVFTHIYETKKIWMLVSSALIGAATSISFIWVTFNKL